GPAGEEVISPALTEDAGQVSQALQAPQTREAASQTDSSYAVDHHLLSAPVVENLVLQLQGVADCLLSLPFTELGVPGRHTAASSSSQPAVPVFCGPPSANVSAVTEDVPATAAERADSPGSAMPDVASPPTSAAPHARRSMMPWSFLCLVLLGAKDSGSVFPRALGLALHLGQVRGSFFSPNASGSEEEPAPTETVCEGHRPGNGPAGAADVPDPADARLVYNHSAPPDLDHLPGSMRSVHVGYQEPEHIPPLGVLQAHADNRGELGGGTSALSLLGVRGRLDLPSHIDVVQDTVTFRSGDCFRVDTAADHTPASEFARLEDVDQETAEAVIQDAPGSVSSGRRQAPWLGSLLCMFLCPLRPGMLRWWFAGLSVSLAMHRPGSFPWQLPTHERSFRSSDPDEAVRVLYYSPFVGVFPPYRAGQDTDHSVAWAQFLNDDVAWAVDFFPVWPGLHFNAFAFVPVGGDASTVTAVLHYAGFDRAVLMPRTVTDTWLQSFASHQVSADIGHIYLPHALEIWRFYDVPPPDCRLRNGDVLYLYDRDRQQEPLEFEGPWDIQTSGTGQHAPWAVGFRLDSDTDVDLLRPGHRPTPVTIPAGETWAPVQCTFSGAFHLDHPGMWTPVQWTTSIIPQLMQAHGVAAYANVVVASAAGRRVRPVPRMVDRDTLAACTGLHGDSLTLGGEEVSKCERYAPSQVTLRSLAAQFRPWPRSLTSSPACGVRDPHAPLRARNGDTLAYVPPFRDPEWCQVQWPRYQDPVEAMKCASWTVPFMIEWDGVARFWSTYSSSPQVVILRERTWWDPLQGTFCDFRGDRLGGTWVPVLHGFSEHLHMLDHAGVRAVHVMCIDDERDDTSCHNAFLPGPYSHQPPHGWQWHPGMASLQPSSLRTGDVLVPDRSVDGRFDPWTQSIQRFVSLVVAGALVATGRLWGLLILLACVTPGAEAMQQPLAFSFNAFRVGRFPWRENHPAATIASLSTQEDVDTVYLSPFSGPGQVLTLPGTSSVAEWSTALLQQDPAWGASACPVWPTVSAGAMIAVPRPPSLHLVCLHVTTHLEHFAISVPRVTTLAWLVSALRNARALDVLSLRIPPALGQTPGDGQDEIHWRTGDLVVALPPDAFTGLFQTPVFVRAEQLRHCAIWSLDFWLAAKADAVMWQPESRPLLTTVPRSSRWCALDSTFEGVFVDRYPGIWTPVPWIAEDRPHLIQVSSSAHLVHVVVETPDTCFCAAVQAHTERQQLWADLPTLRRPPRVLSIPDAELELGTTLRDGDVVVEPPSAAVRGHPLQWGLLGLLLGLRGPAGFWAGAFLFPLGLSYGTRLDYAAGYHRLWTPFGTLLGPAVGPGHVCPSALRDQLPAWGTFARVVPPVVSTDIEWVPRSPDQALASVVLVSPPAPRVVLLPTRSPSAHLLRTLQTMLPELTTVLAHPAVWRGSQHFTHPTLSLRDGDVVHVKADRWFPMLRAPPSASFPTVVHAASLAFWGLPFAVEQPGMIFAWQPGEICPLCLPTVRGETWDPVGLTFRPTLASFSPDRWIPTQRRDRLGLHLVLDSTRPGWVHLITKGFPPRAVARPRQALPDSTRDGDFDPVAAKAAQMAAPPSLQLGMEVILCSTYAVAWGAPPVGDLHVDLDETAKVYAQLSAHYLGRPLRKDLPSLAPPAHLQAWHSFPLWGGGVPDGSGVDTGSWAFVAWALWHNRWYRIGWDGGSLGRTPWLPMASDQVVDVRSFLGELGALSSAAAWVTAWWDCLRVSTRHAPARVTLAVDNTAALSIAAGHAGADRPAACLARCLWQAAQSRFSTTFRHVPGHSGKTVNELADFLAGYSAQHPLAASCGYSSLPPDFAASLLSVCHHLWLLPKAARTPVGLRWEPSVALPSSALGPAEVAQHAVDPAQPRARPVPVPLRVVQANIQTIKDVDPTFFNKEGHGQRRLYLAKQLKHLKVHVAFLQECRSRAGRWASHGFLSWRSGGIQGGFGVEVWVDPACASPQLQLDDWRICYADPRILIVPCCRADLPLILVSAHAPHADRPAAEIRAFWVLLSQQVRQLPQHARLCVGLDANADFVAPDEDEALVGTLLANRLTRPADDFLLRFAQEFGLMAPGTWSSIHQGPSWTWQHTSGRRQRLDHLLVTAGIPVSDHEQCEAFDIVNGDSRDHMPIWCLLQVPAGEALVRQGPHRYPAVVAAEVCSSLWQKIQPRDDLPPDRQLALLKEAHASRPPFVRRQPYVSAEAETLLHALRDSRAEARRLTLLQDRLLMSGVWQRWRHIPEPAQSLLLKHQLRLQLAHLQTVTSALRRRAHALARRDKRMHFATLLGDATAHWHSTGRVMEATNKLAWASKSARARREVRAASGFDIDDALQAQFQQQEAGQIVSQSQLQTRFQRWARTSRAPCPLAIPSLLELEALCRAQKAGKAPGPDTLRNEVWRGSPERAGRWLFPICFQIGAGTPEPIDFKDSSVCALHKKGPAHLPASFRSIAMLNGVAKLWHSQVRATVGQQVLGCYHVTQLGGRRGIDTSMALAVFRCATDAAALRGRSWAAFFIDIQAAYYETDRGLLFEGADLRPALDALALPAHIHALIENGVLRGLGVPEDQIALLRDCVECSFWTFVGHSSLVVATRGSRPGDGLADVLFGALYAVIMQCIQAACATIDVAHHSLSLAMGSSEAALQLAWADDLCLVADFASAAEALHLLPQVASIILRIIEAFRFRVNLGEGKTEVLVYLCGTGATKARQQLLTGHPHVQADDGRQIRVVAEYKYLGVPQRAVDSGRRDMEASAARGRAVWTQAANLVHAPSLPWPLKLAWLQGRTLPAAYSSLATSLAASARALAPLKGFYEQCVRHLAATWQDGHHASSENLAVCASAPDVDTSLCVARVRLLCRILQGRSPFVFEAFAASWDRAGRFASLLQQAVRELWPATNLPPLDVGGPTLALVARSSRSLLQACRRVSRHGTMLRALCHMWCSFRTGKTKAVIGAALPQTCQLCQAVLPSQHALAAHLHRMHGQVALSTQYTCGTSCLWCLSEFHNSARLRYHLQHSASCEHGLRCVVGPVYTYGSGTKRSGKKGHLRAPILRIAGPINATPAQRQASLEGRACSLAELAEELQRLAPGPGFASSARSTTVVPRPTPSTSASHVEPPSEPAPTPASALPSSVTWSSVACSWSWGAFSEFACPDDVLVPSLRWDAPQPPRVWAIPVEWYRCLRSFIQISRNEPWSPATWRVTAFLRKEAAPSSLDAPADTTFAVATQVRQLFMRRLVTLRWLLSGLGSEHALWFRAPLAPAWHAFLLRKCPGAVFLSTVPILGFGTLLAMPRCAPPIFSFLKSTGVAHSRVFRLVAPHCHA
ncbi:unnamed protein product, partial [Symbiodinium microadriaticum]